MAHQLSTSCMNAFYSPWSGCDKNGNESHFHIETVTVPMGRKRERETNAVLGLHRCVIGCRYRSAMSCMNEYYKGETKFKKMQEFRKKP
ncbi:hypothetical protein WA026_007189 [Henosepilachna vigintioctopunctata]|uniref:Uncharacterized protein n=1 Tax=Henosepilachna vigintioctopunctata TaxID=420089 RepID=A0AAW1V9V2_9CUCU